MSTANLGLTKSTVGVDSDATAASREQTNIDILDLHDHTSGKGVKIPSGGININASLEFNNQLATEVKGTSYYSQSSNLTDTNTVFVKDGDLYFIDASSNVIRITQGAALSLALPTSGQVLLDDGNARGATVRAGTNDTHAFILETNGSDRLKIEATGLVRVLTEMGLESSANSSTGTLNDVSTSSVSHVRMTGASATAVTGFANGASGKILVVTNQTGTDLTLSNESTSSVAANRIVTGTGGDIQVADGSTAILIYDSTESRWSVASGAAASSGGSGRNYLSKYYEFSTDPSTDMVTTLTSTGNRTSNTDKWGATTTSLLSRDTTSKLRGANSGKIVNGSSASNFVESPLFTLDAIDCTSGALAIEFDLYEGTSGAAAGDWTIKVIRYNSSGTYQEAITPSITSIPVGYYQFKTLFTPSSTTTDQYALRFISNTASARTLYIDYLSVNPNRKFVASAVSQWVAFTPTFSAGFGTVTNAAGFYRRVGDSMEIQASCTAGTTAASIATIVVPASLNIDSTKKTIANTSSNPGSEVGTYQSVGANSAGKVVTATGTSTTLIYFGGTTGSATPLTPANGNSVAVSSVVFAFKAIIPIAEWSTTITVVPSQTIEYAYNTSTSTTASDTSSFAYGAQGAAIQSITAALSRQVRFQSPIQPTDRVVVEVSTDRKHWSQVGSLLTASGYNVDLLRFDGTNNIGIGLWPDDSLAITDVKVFFGRYSTGTSTSWANVATSYWRVAKYSSVGGTEVATATATSAGTITRESQWTAYTPTISAGFGTASSISFYYKVVGDSLLVRGQFQAGTVAASIASVTLPTGFNISTTKITASSTGTSTCPMVGFYGTNFATGSGWVLTATSTAVDRVYFSGYFSGANMAPINGNAIFGSNQYMNVQFEVPIV